MSSRHSQEKSPHLYPWDKGGVQECSLSMEWKPHGKILLDNQNKLIFPKTETAPAIYRLRIQQGKKEAIYIGETDNLSRRFGNYRNPGPSQQTSLRINALLKDALHKNAEISVSVVTAGAWIDHGKSRKTADLSSKIVRCLLENAAIMCCGGIEIEMLNRAR